MAALLAAHVRAEDVSWQIVGASSSNSVAFIDVASVRQLPAKIGREFVATQAWVMWDHSNNKREKARTSKHLMRFDCSGEQLGTFSFASFAPDGELISSWNQADDYDFNYQPSVPGSVGSMLLRAVCDEMAVQRLERAADDLRDAND